jgi:hypothetical protein
VCPNVASVSGLSLENPRGNQEKDNPETLATLGTQDTGQINVRENPRGNQEKDNPETLATLGTQDIGQINVRENVASVSGLSFS